MIRAPKRHELFVPQGGHGIDAGGAAGGQQAGDQHDK